jgi:hypothetical protein
VEGVRCPGGANTGQPTQGKTHASKVQTPEKEKLGTS